MGKPKVRGSRANRKAVGGKKKKEEEPRYSIEDLLERASDLLDECQFDAAEKFCQRALEEGLTDQLSSAYVSLSELYMSDLCDEPEAQAEAERFISLAIQTHPSNPEAWQAEASYRLVTEQFEAAKESMSKSLALWLPQHSAFLETGEGGQTDLSYNSRINTVKLLLDLEMFEEATQISEGLIEEDDEVVAPWYLLGWLNFLKEDSDYWGNVRHYLAKAKQVQVRNPTDDQEMMKHIEEILAEVGEEEEEPSEQREGIELQDEDEEDQERLEKVANILDNESEPDSDNRMES